jgi:hypothetical protein
MNRGKLALQIILLFVACVIGYALVFRWIEHRRVANAPWTVTFTEDGNQPSIEITQTNLNLQRIRITFADAPRTTNTTQIVEFAQARNVPFDLPFGQCVFQDTLFQPGTIAMKMFGHEIQLMPRALTIDGKERTWQSGEQIKLQNNQTNSAR